MTAAPSARTVSVWLPIRTVSEANMREHHQRKARRTADQRGTVMLRLRVPLSCMPLPVVVTLARCSPRKLDDDNLRGALKAVRDGVADALRLKDDSDPRVTWEYEQRRDGCVAVVIIVRPHDGLTRVLKAAVAS